MPFFDKYPYTNFHNVNLDWVLERVKEWGALVEQNNTAFHELEEANEDFKNYVTSYLENLDVQEEINNKLDSMLESGVLTDYLQPYVSSTVTTWLDENITEPTGVVIDSSLTVAGACADAKAAGDGIRNNKTRIDGISYNTDMMLTKLQELLETVDATTGVFIAGYNDNNSSVTNPAAMPYVFVDYISVSDFTVNSIYINVEQTGRLSIGKVLKSDIHFDEVVDRSKYIYLDTVEVSTLGRQTITFNRPIIIESDYYLVLGQYGDGIRWFYGQNGELGFGFVRAGDQLFRHNTTYSLGVNVIGTSIQTDYRKVIKSILANKKISILGDSISTYNNYIPSGNTTYYPRGTVTNVNDTWWKKVINALGLILDTNNSWSGSRVTTTNGDASAGCMTRSTNLGNPDIIIVYMGINDFNAEVVLGDYDGKNVVPTNTTIFASAYCVMLNKILTTYKTAKVYCCTLVSEERNLIEGFPELNENGISLTEYNNMIKKICDIFNVGVLDIAKCGLTYQNMDIYNPDKLHPTKEGHSLIANYIINALDNAVSTRYS